MSSATNRSTKKFQAPCRQEGRLEVFGRTICLWIFFSLCIDPFGDCECKAQVKNARAIAGQEKVQKMLGQSWFLCWFSLCFFGFVLVLCGVCGMLAYISCGVVFLRRIARHVDWAARRDHARWSSSVTNVQ